MAEFKVEEIAKAAALQEAVAGFQAEAAAKAAKDKADAFRKATEEKAKELSEGRKARRADLLKKSVAAAEKYWDSELTGTIVPFTEKDAANPADESKWTTAPAMVIGVIDVPVKKDGEVQKTKLGNVVEETKLRVLVFSDKTKEPYRAETSF